MVTLGGLWHRSSAHGDATRVAISKGHPWPSSKATVGPEGSRVSGGEFHGKL